MSTADVRPSASSSGTLTADPRPRPDLNGKLYQELNGDRIYLIDTGFKRYLSNLNIFTKDRPIDRFDVTTVTTGSDVKPNAVLIQADSTGTVYLVDVNPEPGSKIISKRPIKSADTFNRYSFNWGIVQGIPSLVVEGLPIGEEVPPKEVPPKQQS